MLDYDKRLRKIIKPLKTKWWEAIVQSFIGALFFSIFVAALAFVYSQKDSDLLKSDNKPVVEQQVNMPSE